MSTYANGTESRLLTLESRVGLLQTGDVSLASRVAALEQSLAQRWGGGGGSGGGNGVFPAVSTTAVTAGGTGSVLLATGATVVCNNWLGTTLAISKKCMVGQDFTGAYWLLSGDC